MNGVCSICLGNNKFFISWNNKIENFDKKILRKWIILGSCLFFKDGWEILVSG